MKKISLVVMALAMVVASGTQVQASKPIHQGVHRLPVNPCILAAFLHIKPPCECPQRTLEDEMVCEIMSMTAAIESDAKDAQKSVVPPSR